MRALKEVRLLIVGWKPNTNQFLRTVLESLDLPAFTRISRTDEALAMMRDRGFELVFCTSDAGPDTPTDFTRLVRRDVHSRDPTVPIVIVAPGATSKEIEIMRDAGADNVMCPPMSAEAMGKRLERLLLQSRAFVISKAFVGPDRRRSGDREISREDRRVSQEVVFYQPPRLGRG